MLNGPDIETLLVDNREAGSQHCSDTGFASLLEGIGSHSTNGASAHNEDSGFIDGGCGGHC